MTEMMARGKAGEHLVCADLLLLGHHASLATEGMPYDVIAQIHGKLYRVQVKTTLEPRNVNTQGRNPNRVYAFDTRRKGYKARQRMSDQECDLVACVALDTRQIAYLPTREAASVTALYPTGHEFKGAYKMSRRVTINDLTLEKALSI